MDGLIFSGFSSLSANTYYIAEINRCFLYLTGELCLSRVAHKDTARQGTSIRLTVHCDGQAKTKFHRGFCILVSEFSSIFPCFTFHKYVAGALDKVFMD